jgi:hypothetical protein
MEHVRDSLRIDRPQVADRGGEPELRDLAHLDDDLVAAAFHECAQLDQQAVLVAYLCGDAVPVRGEPLAERVAVGCEE